MSGEYFLTDKVKDDMKNKKKREEKIAQKQLKLEAKAKEYDAPEGDLPAAQDKKSKKESSDAAMHKRPDVDELKNKFLKKKPKVV